MAETSGAPIRAGWQREAVVTAPTWPAASAAALTALAPAIDLRPNDGVIQASVSTVNSGLGPVTFDLLSKLPTVDVEYQGVYQGLEPLWACALGHMAKRIGSTLLPETLAAGVYRHLYELDPRLSTSEAWKLGDGFQFGTELLLGQRKVRRGTFAADVQVSVWEWLSSMIMALTLDVGLDGATLTIELCAHSLSRSSAVNTAATMALLLPSTAPRILLHHLRWRVAPYSAVTPLAVSDEVKCTGWTLRLENNLQAVPGKDTGLAPQEYERARDPQVTVTFVVPRHVADTWQSRWGSGTVLMAEARFLSERLIAPGQPYRLSCYLPSCVTTNAQLGVQGAQLPPDTVQLMGVIPSGAAAGFPSMSHLGPLSVEVVSGVATNPLLN